MGGACASSSQQQASPPRPEAGPKLKGNRKPPLGFWSPPDRSWDHEQSSLGPGLPVSACDRPPRARTAGHHQRRGPAAPRRAPEVATVPVHGQDPHSGPMGAVFPVCVSRKASKLRRFRAQKRLKSGPKMWFSGCALGHQRLTPEWPQRGPKCAKLPKKNPSSAQSEYKVVIRVRVTELELRSALGAVTVSMWGSVGWACALGKPQASSTEVRRTQSPWDGRGHGTPSHPHWGRSRGTGRARQKGPPAGRLGGSFRRRGHGSPRPRRPWSGRAPFPVVSGPCPPGAGPPPAIQTGVCRVGPIRGNEGRHRARPQSGLTDGARGVHPLPQRPARDPGG